MTHLPSRPRASLIDIFRDFPEVGKSLHDLGETIMRGASPFSPGARELLAAFVSRLNGCRFCELSHAGAAARFGMDVTLLDALAKNVDAAPLEDRLKPVFRHARTLTLQPDAVTPAEVAAILEAGWGEEGVVHVNLVCGFFALMNRLVEGLGLEADPAVIEMAARQLHEKGYHGVAQMLGQDRG